MVMPLLLSSAGTADAEHCTGDADGWKDARPMLGPYSINLIRPLPIYYTDIAYYHS